MPGTGAGADVEAPTGRWCRAPSPTLRRCRVSPVRNFSTVGAAVDVSIVIEAFCWAMARYWPIWPGSVGEDREQPVVLTSTGSRCRAARVVSVLNAASVGRARAAAVVVVHDRLTGAGEPHLDQRRVDLQGHRRSSTTSASLIFSAYSRTSSSVLGVVFGVEPGLLEVVLVVVEQRAREVDRRRPQHAVDRVVVHARSAGTRTCRSCRPRCTTWPGSPSSSRSPAG